MSTKIYYQGEAGAYSHIVGNHYAQLLWSDTVIWVKSFTEIFESIWESGFGIIPIENSYAGSVHENFFNLAKYNVEIYDEYFLPVHHCLASKSENIQSIEKIFSHYQALAQCDQYTTSHGWVTENYSDTSRSAKYVSESNNPSYAAICSELAWEIYGLNILERDIQDQTGNTTRFFLVGREWQYDNPEKKGKISLLFRAKSVPWVLYKCLGAFATRTINITKIESLPAKDSPFEYMFWMDIDGFMQDANIAWAIEELGFFTSDIRILWEY